MQTLMTPAKSAALLRLLARVWALPGAICELGVYQGGTLKALAEAAPQKECYGFDTFEGQPAAMWRPIDFHKPGEFADTSLAAVSAAMPRNVTLRPGLFPASAGGLEIQVCFAHVDFDLEKSTERAIEWLQPRMSAGGIIAFDDYKWPNCDGVAPAIERAGLRVRESAPCQVYWVAP